VLPLRYFDVLPSKFGTPLCFNEEDLLGLEGTSLFHATQQQVWVSGCCCASHYADERLGATKSAGRRKDNI
jgi:hypothetical protein